MKGIVLAGGTGTRLWPTTASTSKQLLPVYDKPMIYYSLSTLMRAGIRDILIICAPEYLSPFRTLLSNGEKFGIKIEYRVQESPEGIGQSFVIGEDWIRDDSVCLILGDNIFSGNPFSFERNFSGIDRGALITGYQVKNPSEYGVAVLNESDRVISLEEKPAKFISKIAIPGIYAFDNSVISRAKNLKKSARGEYEIVDILKSYLVENLLEIQILPQTSAWFDCGNPDSLNEASNYIRAIQERQDILVCSPEDIALENNWLEKDELLTQLNDFPNVKYSQYLIKKCLQRGD